MSSVTSTSPPTRDVKFIPETPPPIPHSLDSPQEHLHLSKKPRNYKYWSDDEVKKILCWLTLPENEGKLARNKAQACREVAKKLFDGDEYMAISVRSKLMSLEKSFREAEQLRLQLNTCTKDEVLINAKIKEVSKFHKECKQLFGNNSIDGYIPPISTSPVTPSSIPTPSSTPYSPNTNSRLNHYHPHQQLQLDQHQQQQHSHQHQQYLPHTRQQSSPPSAPIPPSLPPSSSTSSSNQNILPHHECESSFYDTNNNNNNNNSSSLLPHLNEDRLRALSIPPHMTRGSWSLPRVPAVDLPPVEDDENNNKKRKTSQDSGMSSSNNNNNNATNSNVRIARYAAKQASYAAKQAEYEALRSEYEQHKMEYAIRLAEIELDRDALSIKRLELELELVRSREQSKTS